MLPCTSTRLIRCWYLQNGSIDAGSIVSEAKGSASKLKKTKDDGDDAVYEARDPSTASGNRSSVKQETVQEQQIEYRVPGSESGEDDFAKQVFAALEAGCKRLEYSLLQIRKMLQSKESYTKELLDFIKQETNCDDENKIRSADFLGLFSFLP